MLNYEYNKEFEKFEFDYPENKKIDDCIKKFSEVYALSIKENKGGFDSNDFKNSGGYEKFKTNGIRDEKKLETFKLLIFEIFKNDKITSFVDYLAKNQVAID